jgi:hypothetical protein
MKRDVKWIQEFIAKHEGGRRIGGKGKRANGREDNIKTTEPNNEGYGRCVCVCVCERETLLIETIFGKLI